MLFADKSAFIRFLSEKSVLYNILQKKYMIGYEKIKFQLKLGELLNMIHVKGVKFLQKILQYCKTNPGLIQRRGRGVGELHIVLL